MERDRALHSGTTMLELNLLEAVLITAWIVVVFLTIWNLLKNKSFKNLITLIIAVFVPIAGTLLGLLVGGHELMTRSKARRV